MKILKPNFWNRKNNIVSYFLFPFSCIYQLLFFLKKKLTSELSFKIPVICIGNLYVGGTGKTPLSILIAKELIINKKKPAIIKKYYPEHSDEHNLINAKLDSLFLHKKRAKALEEAINRDCNFAISSVISIFSFFSTSCSSFFRTSPEIILLSRSSSCFRFLI